MAEETKKAETGKEDSSAKGADTEAAAAKGEQQEKSTGSSDSENIPPELIVKHPLQNSWTLWFFKNDRTRSWEENQRPIITFSTVEDFWGLYNHIELASRLISGCDYSLFKEGIKPMWEDDENRRGGRWLINLDKKQRVGCLDNFWLEVMLCLIGETFDDHSKYVNGAVVSVRNKGDKIGMWLGDASQQSSIMTIGKMVKERLGIDARTTLGFEAHQDTMKKSGSTAKSRYVV